MYRIKRTKAMAAGKGKPALVAMHYAASITPQGIVDGWTKDVAGAVAVTPGMARRVHDRYAGKPNVGDWELEPFDALAVDLSTAVATDDAIGAAEFRTLQEECRRLLSENAAQQQLLDEAGKATAAAEKARAAAEQALAEQRDTIEQQADHLATLAARVVELEQGQRQGQVASDEAGVEPAEQHAEQPAEPPAEQPPPRGKRK